MSGMDPPRLERATAAYVALGIEQAQRHANTPVLPDEETS